MKIAELGTRTRLMLAMLGLYVLLSAAYAYAVFAVIERLEYELTHNVVNRELQEFASAWAIDQDAPVPNAMGLSGYVEGRDDAQMPIKLRNLAPGLYDDVKIDGAEYVVGHTKVDGTSLYLMLDIESVEQLERELTVFAWTWLLLSLLGTLWVVSRLATSISQPITRLANMLNNMRVDDSVSRLAPQFREKDALTIARAVDGYLERLHGFVEREQAFSEEASHELRTPLAVIESSIALLRTSSGQSAAALTHLERMARSSLLMRQAIEALLFLTREDGGGEDADCRIDDVVRDVLAARSIELNGDNLSLLPLLVRAHPGMANIVISNLVDNARQHGGGHLCISLRDNTLMIADSGQGVSTTEQAKVFERRYKGAGSSGQGLGLSIVRKVCQRLGWQVELASAADTGARAYVHFPVNN